MRDKILDPGAGSCLCSESLSRPLRFNRFKPLHVGMSRRIKGFHPDRLRRVSEVGMCMRESVGFGNEEDERIGSPQEGFSSQRGGQ